MKNKIWIWLLVVAGAAAAVYFIFIRPKEKGLQSASTIGSALDKLGVTGAAEKVSNIFAGDKVPNNLASMVTIPSPTSPNTLATVLSNAPNIAKSISEFANLFRGKVSNTSSLGVKGAVDVPARTSVPWLTDQSMWS